MQTAPLTDGAASSVDSGAARLVEASRRDRKKLTTRRAIRAAALELVAARGFAHVTIDDIALAADIAPRTFFNYFPTKESAVIGADPDRLAVLSARLLARPSEESPLEALRAVLVEYGADIVESFDQLDEDRSVWFHRFSIVREEPTLLGAYVRHISEVEREITRVIAERLGVDSASDPYPALVAAIVLAATRVATLHWGANGAADTLDRIIGAAIDALASGLADPGAFAGANDGALEAM